MSGTSIGDKTTKQLLYTIKTIAHSIGKLRRQLKDTSSGARELDRTWIEVLNLDIINLLRQIDADAVIKSNGATESLARGNFPEFISLIKVDEPFSSEDGRKRCLELIVAARSLEKSYIECVQRWRVGHPKNPSATLKIYQDPYAIHEATGYVCSPDDFDGIMIYSEGLGVRSKLIAEKIAGESYGPDSRIENWHLTKKQCRQLGVKYPARAQGLHH